MDRDIKIVVTIPNGIKDILADVFQSVIDINILDQKENYSNKKYLAPKDIEQCYGIHRNLLAYWRDMNQGPPYRLLGRITGQVDGLTP